jgi:hypothetical protein
MVRFMAWWNDFVDWFNSVSGQRVILSAILPFLAIVVAGIIAAAIGRGSATRVLAHEDRELTGAAIMALIVVGRKAAIWSSLGADEKQHVDSLMSESDIRVRLLPVGGSGQAAEWAAHQLADMKKNSASFSFQAEQTFGDYRDRLLDWARKPGRAKKLFASDLEQWRYEDETPASAPPQEWTPAPAEPAKEWAPARVDPAPTTGAVAVTPTTGTVPVTPGLATAPPPTVTAIAAPPPSGLTTSAPPTGSTDIPLTNPSPAATAGSAEYEDETP